jgi:hypothetical protein
MLSNDFLAGFRSACARNEITGGWPKPGRRVEGAFDARLPEFKQGTAEASGLDDDFDWRRETPGGFQKLTTDQSKALLDMCDECSSLDEVKDHIRSLTRHGEDDDPPVQPSVSSLKLTEGDPDPHILASAGDRRRHGMDSNLRGRFQRGLLSERDYTRLAEEQRRWGKPKAGAAAAKSFDQMYGADGRVRIAY